MKYILSIVLLIPLFGLAQKTDCTIYHDGTFYNYPKNSAITTLSIRNGNVSKEVDEGTTDTSYWSIKWLNNCRYELRFQNSKGNMNGTKPFLKEHSMVCSITELYSDYYIYEAYLDKINGMFITKDTVWLQPKKIVNNRLIFTPLQTEAMLKKEKFSDTSQYAVLYVYRSKKIAGMLIDYPVYVENLPIFFARNNSASIFKFYRQGSATFTATTEAGTTTLTQDIKFGKIYYLKCTIHILTMGKADLKFLPEDKGKDEFEDVGR